MTAANDSHLPAAAGQADRVEPDPARARSRARHRSPAGGASASSRGGVVAAAAAATSGGPPAAPPTGNVAQWIDRGAARSSSSAGVPAEHDQRRRHQHDHPARVGRATRMRENNWDSNAAAGHPSKGLMQTIDSTFNSYALPGHKDIWNPVDNIVAGVRYALSRYGSLDNVPGVAAVHSGGSYVGYWTMASTISYNLDPARPVPQHRRFGGRPGRRARRRARPQRRARACSGRTPARLRSARRSRR